MEKIKEIKSRIQIIGIKMLITPEKNNNYYLYFQVNNSNPIKTQILEFDKDNKCILSQYYDLEDNVNKFKSIIFEIYDEKIPDNILFKASVSEEKNLQKTTHGKSYLIGLKNNKGENCAIVYFDFEFNNKENLEKENNDNIIKNYENNSNNQSAPLSIKDLLKNNNNIYDIPVCSLFIQNLEYLKFFLVFVEKVIRWENKWQTLSYLFMLTLIILNFKFFFVFILPLGFIFYHLKFKDKIQSFLIEKSSNSLNGENSYLFYMILDYYNRLFDFYEFTVNKLIIGDVYFVYELYKSIIIIFIFNFIIFYMGGLNYLNLPLIFIFCMWILVLSFNPSFYSFELFIFSLINFKITPILKSKKSKIYISTIKTILSYTIPFYNIINCVSDENMENSNKTYSLSHSISQEQLENNNNISPINANTMKRNSISFSSGNNLLKNKIENEKKNENNEILKYEIYENERWWMLVGWKKNMIKNEIPLWCKVNDKKNFCDLNMVFLPNNNKDKYKWIGEWKIEKSINTDENGWEYSSDFNSSFVKKKEGNYVRRRKWVRFASKI